MNNDDEELKKDNADQEYSWSIEQLIDEVECNFKQVWDKGEVMGERRSIREIKRKGQLM